MVRINSNSRNRLIRFSQIVKIMKGEIQGRNPNIFYHNKFTNDMTTKFYEFAENYGFYPEDENRIGEDIEMNAEYLNEIKEIVINDGYQEKYISIDSDTKDELTKIADLWDDNDMRQFIKEQDLFCTPYSFSSPCSGVCIDTTIHVHNFNEASDLMKVIYENNMDELSSNREVANLILHSNKINFMIGLRLAIISLSYSFITLDDISEDDDIRAIKDKIMKEVGYDEVSYLLSDVMSKNEMAFVYACMYAVCISALKLLE